MQVNEELIRNVVAQVLSEVRRAPIGSGARFNGRHGVFTCVNEAVSAALKHLPPHQREAFVLHRFQDMSYEDVAAVTNTPIGTVKSRVVRAERALRPLLARFKEYI